MSLLIIGKISSRSLAAFAVAMFGLFMAANPVLFKKWFLNPHDVEIYGIGLAESTNQATFSNSQALQCQIDEAEKFDCKVQEITKLIDDTSNAKKQAALNAFVSKHKAIDLTSVLSTKKMYKITTLSSSFYVKDWKSQNIKVCEKKDSDAKSLGSISSLFSVKKKSETFTSIGSTHMFVGQAQENKTIAGFNKCSWKQTPSTEGSQDCKIFPFVDNDGDTDQQQDAKISVLTFKQTDTVANKTKQHHYYLIQFTNAIDESKELSSFDDTEIIYSKDTDSGVDTVTFGKLSAVLVFDDQLLILKQQSGA